MLKVLNKNSIAIAILSTLFMVVLGAVVKELPAGDYVLMFHNESKTTDHTVKVRMYLEQ